jgi:hypothetical protein
MDCKRKGDQAMNANKRQTKSQQAAWEKEEIEARGTLLQEPMMNEQPQKEHQWLQKLVGEWTFEGEMTMEPGQPPEKFTGTESVRSLGGLWILAEGRSEMPDGSPATTIMTLGYNPQRERFVGTVIGSMMTHMWVYDGGLDAAEKVLTLHTEGPNMAAEGKMARFKDVIEFKSDDHRVLTSQMLGDDGKWHEVMRGHYRRQR